VTRLRELLTRFSAIAAALVLVLGLAIPVVVSPQRAHADNLLASRSLNLASSAMGDITTDFHGNAVAPGEGGNGQKTKHSIKFTMATSGATVGSITIMYCTSPILQNSCTTPTGLDATHVAAVTVAATSGSLAGGSNGGFSLDTTTTNDLLSPSANGFCKNLSGVSTTDTVRANCVSLKRSSAVAETGTPGISITYGGGSSDYITNPHLTQTNNLQSYTFYARIQIFATTSYTTLVDYGGTAASTAQQIDVLAKVQEVLNFSVGAQPLANVGTACTPLGSQSGGDDGFIQLGDANSVLSTLQAYDNHTYFRVNSNTVNGTKVYYSGYTLTSGSNTINPMGTSQPGPPTTPDFSTPGSKQFGIAIDSSDTQSGAGYSFTDMSATAPYNHGDGSILFSASPSYPTDAQFAYTEASVTTPVEIAHSSGGIACDTGSVRYLANVSTSTAAGIYTTTITYIATGTY
jgi:hypothetical protein